MSLKYSLQRFDCLIISEVDDTPITNNHGGTKLIVLLSKSTPSPEEHLQYDVETW